MIDEIIETDPDEAQHHPIVDGDAYEEEEDDYQYNRNLIETEPFVDLEESKEFGYDSTFFKKKAKSPKIAQLPDTSQKFAKFSVVRPTSSH
jgi:hypothetical protein